MLLHYWRGLFPEETDPPPCSDPEDHRVGGYYMLPPSRGMRAFQKKFCQKVLLATVQGRWPAVSLEELVRAL